MADVEEPGTTEGEREHSLCRTRFGQITYVTHQCALPHVAIWESVGSVGGGSWGVIRCAPHVRSALRMGTTVLAVGLKVFTGRESIQQAQP